jgi:hypothetical protein
MSGCMIGYGLLGSYINMGVCLLFVMWHFGWGRCCVRVMTWGDYPSFFFVLLYLFFGLSGLVGRVVAGLSLLE